MDVGISNLVSLPPSTGNVRNVNVERVEIRYTDIASLIHDLTRHDMVRGVNVVNDNLIKII